MAGPLLAAALAAPIIGGLMGQDAARGQLKDAKRARAEALAQYAGISVPEIEKQMLEMELLQSAGQYDPDLDQALSLGPSSMENVSTDPRLKSAQMNALAQLGGIAETGMSPADQASFELARRGAAQENQAMQGQILQQMQARGQGGSGAELIAKLTGAQKSADSMQAAQLEQAKAQQAARMQALNQVGALSSNIQNQDFNQSSRIAEAKDLINQYNTRNSQSVANANTAAKNAAQLANLQNQQNIMNQNVALRNQQQQANKGLYQQQFNNQVGLAAGKAGQYNSIAQASQQGAANTAGMYGTIGQGIGTGITAYNTANKPAAVPGMSQPSYESNAMNFDPTKYNNQS